MTASDLYIIGIAVRESETDAPLVINRNRELTRSISSQFVKPVARRHSQIIQGRCQIDVLKFPHRSPRSLRRKLPRFSCDVQFPRVFVGKCLDHSANVICHVTVVNRDGKSVLKIAGELLRKYGKTRGNSGGSAELLKPLPTEDLTVFSRI
jgi:hypothetical protein